MGRRVETRAGGTMVVNSGGGGREVTAELWRDKLMLDVGGSWGRKWLT